MLEAALEKVKAASHGELTLDRSEKGEIGSYAQLGSSLVFPDRPSLGSSAASES